MMHSFISLFYLDITTFCPERQCVITIPFYFHGIISMLRQNRFIKGNILGVHKYNQKLEAPLTTITMAKI